MLRRLSNLSVELKSTIMIMIYTNDDYDDNDDDIHTNDNY